VSPFNIKRWQAFDDRLLWRREDASALLEFNIKKWQAFDDGLRSLFATAFQKSVGLRTLWPQLHSVPSCTSGLRPHTLVCVGSWPQLHSVPEERRPP
jgi:hypothetical protein